MQANNQRSPKLASRSTAGFTLLELLIVVTLFGIISAIVAPSCNAFVNRLRLNTAQNQVYRAMQEAKSNAVRDKVTWQASIRENNGVVQWAVHPAESGTSVPVGVQWNNLDPSVQVYKDKNARGTCETTFSKTKATKGCPLGPWRVQFNYIGNTNGQLGQITLIAGNSSNVKRCVYASTLIGTLRTGKEHRKPNSSKKYCY